MSGLLPETEIGESRLKTAPPWCTFTTSTKADLTPSTIPKAFEDALTPTAETISPTL